MKQIDDSVMWLNGLRVQPWEYEAVYELSDEPFKITYMFSYKNHAKGTEVWEREPSRHLEIKNPDEYDGFLG